MCYVRVRVLYSTGGDDDVSSYRDSVDDQSIMDDESERSTYFYTAMPVTPSHQQTARTRLSSSVRISTHQILAALMCREPQSIRQLHDWLSELNQEHAAEIALLTTTRRTSHSAVEQAARSATPCVLISEQQILAILDVLQIMGLVTVVARRKKDILKVIEKVDKGKSKKGGGDIPSSTSYSISSERWKEEKAKAYTEYDGFNHFESALYTMTGNAKGPQPLGSGYSDLCAPASAELGKLPIFSNLHVDTEARVRNTAATQARIEKLKELITKMKADIDAEPKADSKPKGESFCSDIKVDIAPDTSACLPHFPVPENTASVTTTVSNVSNVNTTDGTDVKRDIDVPVTSENNEVKNAKAASDGEIAPGDSLSQKMDVDDEKHDVPKDLKIEESKDSTCCTAVEKKVESLLLSKHRVMFREYMKSSMEAMKRPLHPDAVSMGSNTEEDLLYRTIQYELNVCMRYAA